MRRIINKTDLDAMGINGNVGFDCVMCGKSRFAEDGYEKLWRSDLGIIIEGNITDAFSVCPDCREKHTLAEIYKKLIDNISEGMV